MYFPKESVGGTIMANLGIIIAILFMVVYIVMFILYNLADNVSEALNASAIKTVSLSFIPVFVVPLVLSVPVIQRQVAADKSLRLIRTIKKSENEGDAVISKINREGIS